jgi:hypothetical protein
MTTTAPPADRATPPPERFQFRITDLLLVTLLVALAAAAIAQQSLPLFLLFIVVSATCLYRWQGLWKPLRLMEAFAILGIIAVLIGLLLPDIFVHRGGAPSRRMACQNNLRQIGIALHNYHDTYGTLPPAYIADENGKPMHSWRVLILPFMEQEPLYKQYRFDEPWNGPNNSKLANQFVSVYCCPSHYPSLGTSYVAIVGAHTAWPGEKALKLADLKDGTDSILLVVEVHDSGIHWMEPRDFHVSQMAQTINAPHGQGISSEHTRSANVVKADGAVRYLSNDTPAESLRSWIYIDDGTLPGDLVD